MRQSKQRTSSLKRFSQAGDRGALNSGPVSVDSIASACAQQTPADVDPHPRTKAPRALAAQAKSLRCGERARPGAPVGYTRPGRASARANAASSAGLLTVTEPPQSRATPFASFSFLVHRIVTRRHPPG